MYACINETGRGFFEGFRRSEDRPPTFRDPPPPLLFANDSMPVLH
jgi:hypothetical protein